MSKALKIIKKILVGVIIFIFMIVIINQGMTIYEKHIYKEPGKMVTVDNKNIHVYEKGNGNHTILLMSGIGTAAPVLDYEPLINELSENNKVVVVEGFGYGWSDFTDKQRSVENIVEELRTVLKEADISGPYILMPHSISGIYSMYYADKYPDEVEGFVGIDSTLPRAGDYFNEELNLSIPSFMKFLAPMGIVRIQAVLNSKNILPEDDNNVYSEENLKETKAISSWKLYNKTVVEEAEELNNNIEKTKDIEFNKNLPVLLFTKESSKVRKDGKTNEGLCKSYLENIKNGQIVVLDGHHYLHWTQSEKISKLTNEFINNL